MSNPSRVAKIAKEISEIAEWNRTNLRKESHFNWESLILFTFLMLLPVGVYLLIK